MLISFWTNSTVPPTSFGIGAACPPDDAPIGPAENWSSHTLLSTYTINTTFAEEDNRFKSADVKPGISWQWQGSSEDRSLKTINIGETLTSEVGQSVSTTSNVYGITSETGVFNYTGECGSRAYPEYVSCGNLGGKNGNKTTMTLDVRFYPPDWIDQVLKAYPDYYSLSGRQQKRVEAEVLFGLTAEPRPPLP